MTLLTTDEAAEQIGVQPRMIRRRINLGQLPATKQGTQWMIDEADLAPLRKRSPTKVYKRRRQGTPTYDTCPECGGRKKSTSLLCQQCRWNAVPVEERFWIKVEKADGCWMWKAYCSPDNGYGMFGYQGCMQYAHRVAWQLTYGPIPPGLDVCHTCDITGCVRPDHLFLGTRKDNVQDMLRKGRAWQQKKKAT